MKKLFSGILLGLVIGAVATWGWLRHGSAEAPKSAEAAATKPAEKAKENPLHLPPAKRTAAGIVLAKPTEAMLSPTVEAFGRVIDASPLVSLAAELTTAQATAGASTKELERVKKLFAAGNNASAQAVETAEAAAAKDRAAVASARVRLIAGWGRPFAEEARLAQLIDALANGQALIRLDLLPGDLPASEPKLARIGLLGSVDHFDAEIVGSAPVSDPQVQGVSFVALVHDHPLPVGATLRGSIPGQGEAAKALMVSRGALVYHQGSAWIYVLDEEDTFERKLVITGRSSGDQVALTSGVEADQQVVTTGAQQLLAAELQAGEAPEEP